MSSLPEELYSALPPCAATNRGSAKLLDLIAKVDEALAERSRKYEAAKQCRISEGGF